MYNLRNIDYDSYVEVDKYKDYIDSVCEFSKTLGITLSDEQVNLLRKVCEGGHVVSGRRTGKTTLLNIIALHDIYTSDSNVLYITNNAGQGRLVSESFESYNGNAITISKPARGVIQVNDKRNIIYIDTTHRLNDVGNTYTAKYNKIILDDIVGHIDTSHILHDNIIGIKTP